MCYVEKEGCCFFQCVIIHWIWCIRRSRCMTICMILKFILDHICKSLIFQYWFPIDMFPHICEQEQNSAK